MNAHRHPFERFRGTPRGGWSAGGWPRTVPQPVDQHRREARGPGPDEGQAGQGIFLLAALAMLAITAAMATLTQLLT